MSYEGKYKSLTHAYKLFKDENPKLAEKYDEKTYRKICDFSNLLVRDLLIYKNGSFNMYSGLSKIFVVRVKRNYKKKVVDFYETNQQRKQGSDAIIYYTDNWWVRVYWNKKVCSVVNHFFYKFKPVRSFSRELAAYLKKDELNFQSFVKN